MENLAKLPENPSSPRTASNTKPFLSICMPTRNRAQYLGAAVRSVVAQGFQDWELIVMDNSDPGQRESTRKVIASFQEERIRYLEQQTVVSMTENFETTVSAATGEYVLCLGDDDGLVGESLEEVSRILKSRKPAVFKSRLAHYFWPDSLIAPGSLLALPPVTALTWVDSKDVLEKVASFQLPYNELPMLYYGFVRSDILEALRQSSGSVFGDSTSVDMYSGMQISLFCETFLVSATPYCIAGRGGMSNGDNFSTKRKGKIADEYAQQHSLFEQYRKHNLPSLQSLDVVIAMELERLRAAQPERTRELVISRKNLLLRVTGAAANPATPGDRITELREKFEASDPSTDYKAFLSEVSPADYHVDSPSLLYPNGKNSIVIRPDVLRCEDVYSAGLLIQRLYAGEILNIKLSSVTKWKHRVLQFISGPVKEMAKRVRNSLS